MFTPYESQVACPLCQGLTYRIRRRAADRLISLFVPVYRYQCQTHQCRWEGNVAVWRTERGAAK